MIAFVKLVIEVALACHCAGWTATPNGMRCTAPLDHPRCELVEGWHPIAFGIPTCTRGCDARGPD